LVIDWIGQRSKGGVEGKMKRGGDEHLHLPLLGQAGDERVRGDVHEVIAGGQGQSLNGICRHVRNA
jgi:hypothetical protein